MNWLDLVFYLLGVLSGIIFWEKVGVGDVFKGSVRYKQKGKDNRQESQVNQEMTPKTKRRDKKEPKVKRRDRKSNNL